jgi:light-harvesting protein B-800-850 alpha chain
MNQGRIWCVVNPTVGLPLFLGSVAVTSLIVHYSVLSHGTWFGSFIQGGTKAKSAQIETSTPPVAMNATEGANGVVISVAPSAKTAAGETQFVITVAPKVTATAQADVGLPDKVALAPEAR